MHTQDLSAWTHDHEFDLGNPAAERGTRVVMWVTAVMMVVEIVGGWSLNSMALLADGLHMSSHTIAIGLSAFAYAAARRLSKDRRFAFGTWKIEVAVWAWGLIKGTSAILLDREMDNPVVDEIRAAVEVPPTKDGTRITDLHVWRVGKQAFAAALTVVTHDSTLSAQRVRERIAVHPEVVHVTIEILQCA